MQEAGACEAARLKLGFNYLKWASEHSCRATGNPACDKSRQGPAIRKR
jgi:hypothetical protein